MLVALPDRLVQINLDNRQEILVVAADSGSAYFIDMCKIPSNPGEPTFFILHTAKGIQLVNTDKHKCFDLTLDQQAEFNVCSSLSIVPIDEQDLEQGFWMCQIDNSSSGTQIIQAFDFDARFIQGLK